MRCLSIALLVLTACEGLIADVRPIGGTGGGGGGSTAIDDPACLTPLPPGVGPLKRLSALQYRNTVRDLLAASGLGPLAGELGTRLDSVPDDSDVSFRGLDNRVTDQHVRAYFEIAVAIGDAVESSPARLTALAGSCATAPTLTAACADDFLTRFGRRAFRRPLTPSELAELRTYNDGQRPPAEAVRAMVLAVLISPRFLNHLELEGQPLDSERRLQLSAFELASRLSYTYWQTPPDDALLDAAASGALLTEAGYREQVARVFQDLRTEATLRRFWSEWLRLEKFTGFATSRPAFAALAAGEHVGEAGHEHWRDMVDELHELTRLYTFDRPGTFAELVQSDVSVTRSLDVARLYGVPAWSGTGEYPRLTDRKGLFQRAALLVDGLETTNPFHRGALTRRAFLCDPLPQPNPASLPPGALDPPPFDAMQTTRQRFQAKVDGNNLCQGCHGGFSDLGYVMEQFDALGRHRMKEKVYDESSGALLAELQLDTTAVTRVWSDDERPVAGPAELTTRMTDSGKPQACFAQQFTRFALRREPVAEGDRCLAQRLSPRSATLAEVFQGLAFEPAFQQRTVGDP